MDQSTYCPQIKTDSKYGGFAPGEYREYPYDLIALLFYLLLSLLYPLAFAFDLLLFLDTFLLSIDLSNRL